MDINLITELSASLAEKLKPGVKMDIISKENFQENFEILNTRLQNYISCLTEMDDKTKELLAGKILSASKNSQNVACALYSDIATSLNTKDTKHAFESYIFIANTFVSSIKVIARNMNKIFANKGITVHNSKLLHVVVFGVMTEADCFINYATYMLDNVIYETTVRNGVRELPQPRKYRYEYIKKNVKRFKSICKIRLTGSAVIDNAISNSFASELDVNLIAEDNSINSGFFNINKMANHVKASAVHGARRFIIFRWLGEQWNLFKHAKYLKAVKEKEWLQSHIAILKMDAAGIDPDSDEYRKHVKIIEAYNNMLADLDKKIDTYMGVE